ncbi:MAG: MotA/TolQ/ExbB proton channel family protein [Mariprofundaceae bacterium]|nr:MotA/TolQ/ExbB proton channel family protein [Mariprofundaceae bacterium]
MANGRVRQRAADQRALRTFALWMGWCISALTVFAMLYRKANVVDFVQHDATRITWIILGMFALGLAVSFVQAMRLTAEWFRAYNIEVMVKKNGLAGVTMRGGRNIVDRFTDALRLIAERNGRVDVESLVDVEFSAQHRLSQFVGLLGNLMITLGLIGTVLGMTITMNGLHAALGALGINQELLVDGLRSAMSGMGVAFYTTLMGSVLGGVLLRVFSWITDASVNGLQDLMVRTYLVYASADLEPSDDRDIRALDASVTQLNQRMEMLNLAMQASRKEMNGLREDALNMHQALKGMVEEDAIHPLAASHARYAFSVRPGLLNRLFARFRN